MGGLPGKLSEELVTQEKRKKGCRMNCDEGEATEGLENELCTTLPYCYTEWLVTLWQWCPKSAKETWVEFFFFTFCVLQSTLPLFKALLRSVL